MTTLDDFKALCEDPLPTYEKHGLKPERGHTSISDDKACCIEGLAFQEFGKDMWRKIVPGGSLMGMGIVSGFDGRKKVERYLNEPAYLEGYRMGQLAASKCFPKSP